MRELNEDVHSVGNWNSEILHAYERLARIRNLYAARCSLCLEWKRRNFRKLPANNAFIKYLPAESRTRGVICMPLRGSACLRSSRRNLHYHFIAEYDGFDQTRDSSPVSTNVFAIVCAASYLAIMSYLRRHPFEQRVEISAVSGLYVR